MKNILLIIFFCCLLSGSIFSQTSNKLTTEQWREDVLYFQKEMQKVHINPYHLTPKETFDKFVQDLSFKIPGMTDNQIVTEIARMTAMIGDGHTALNIFGFHNETINEKQVIDFHFFPLKTYIFSDGVYVTGASDEYKDIISQKLVSINGIKIGKIMSVLNPLVGRDNDYTIKQFIPLYLITAEYLNGLGIITDYSNVTFTFKNKDGLKSSMKIQPVNVLEMKKNAHADFLKNIPLYMQNDEKNYWFQYIEDRKTLYINYKRVLIDPSDSLSNFCKRLEEFINIHDIEKTIIDVRNNGGGDNGTCQPFVNLISNNKKINIRGKLFTIIGRQTFSAASYLTTKLEFNTNTIFAGEPTGATPNHYGDNKALLLPNSGIEVRLSSIYWQNSFTFDTRKSTEPEINVQLSSDDYFAGKDPILEAIFKYDGKQDKKLVNTDEANLAGKYIFNPVKILEIKKDNNILILQIRQKDFVGRNVTFISTPLYYESGKNYSTGIPGLKLIAEKEPYKISYRGTELSIPKADENFKTPQQLLEEGSIEKAISVMREFKLENAANTDLSERIINGLGYDMIRKNNIDAAIAVFKFNVELYPASFNTFDSLGEAYMIAGNKELAIENYEKSVDLNPKNEGGKKALEKLRAEK